jgi:hypothetical protein
LGTGKAQPPSGRSRAGKRATAVTAAAAIVLTAGVLSYLNAQDPAGWSSSLIGTTVAWPRKAGALGAAGSDAQIARIRGRAG